MTTYQSTVTFDNSSDAAFRAWGSAISAALSAIGLVKTADTGQINWATVTAPVATNTSAGYEIWKMNDTQASACPVFFRLDYGSSSSVSTSRMWTTVGSGTNGAGTVTNVTPYISNAISGSVASGTTVNLNACAVNGAFNLSIGATDKKTLLAIGLWRTCDASGTPTADAAFVYQKNNGSTYGTGNAVIYIPATTTWTYPTNGSFPFYFPSNASQSVWTTGANQSVFAPVMWVNQPFLLLGGVGIGRNDFGPAVTFTATIFGATHTFKHVNVYDSNNYNISRIDPYSNTETTFAILWE